MQNHINNKKGFTIIEILIVLSILTLISFITFGFFVDYRKSQGTTQDVELIASLLYKARSDAISSNGSSDYGVHFASSTATTFKGTTYNPSDPVNQVFSFTAGNFLSIISLTSGGVDVVFNKLTGETNQPGSLTLTTADGSVKVITVYQTGLIQSL
jgi:prepilin-type N-terminal cleavage/methylation domain-containing protein